MKENTPYILDFEKPLLEIYQKIKDLESNPKKIKGNASKKIEELQTLLEKKKVEMYQSLSPWQKVQLSRHPERPYAMLYVNEITTSFVELHGDRNFRDDKAIVGGLAKIDGKSVMIIGHQKGWNTKLRQYRNFGMPYPEGYRKALRMMKMAEKFNIPVITFIDTPGAYPGIEAEDRGQAEAIARNLFEMTKLQVPIISYIIGEGASGGALGIGVCDKLFMLENTWFSVISPESCSSILWRSWDYKEKAAEELKLTANDNLELGIIDGIIPEPLGGAHNNPSEVATTLKAHIIEQLEKLQAETPNARVENRIKRYEAISTAAVIGG